MKFQSTRPRGARLEQVRSVVWKELVSIHAPAWGATKKQDDRGRPYYVSIHAPAWGATSNQRAAAYSSSCFNPRARVGRDGLPSRQLPRCHSFNPRARVGRDKEARQRRRGGCCFNPRARVGRDYCTAKGANWHMMFQSTRPRGARHIRTLFMFRGATFQSTRPRGARLRRAGNFVLILMFQSTRPRGARPTLN